MASMNLLEIKMDQNHIQQITDRISHKLESKGVSPDRQGIADKLASYINDFGVVAYEAERKVLSDQMRLNNIPEDDSVIVPLSTPESEVYSLSEIQPGEWVTVEVKVVSLQTPNSSSIAQTGILADSSGAIRFVLFAKGGEIPPLEFEQWYRIESAVVDLFRDVPSLKLHSGSRVTPITDDRSLMPAPPVHLNDLIPGVAASIKVKFVEEWEIRSDRMLQTGLVADISGKMKFVLWKNAGQEKLTLGSVYNIFYANVDTFRGRLSLALNSSMWMEDEDMDIPVPVVMPEPKEGLPMTSIRDLSAGYASIRVKFVEEWETRSDRMLQTGLVGDETGRIKFILWKDEQKEKLVLGKVYLIKNAKVNEYNGRLSLVLNNAMCEADEPEADIAVGTILETYAGTIVQISGGSGLIKRCPMKGCNRVLSHQNFCPIHEIQNDYHYDLRIKAVLDDGHKAYNVLIGREIAEVLTGMTMNQAINLALESPLGFEEVQTQFTEKLYGRYVRCCGSDFDGRILVKSAEFIHLNSSRTVELMNRAGVSHEGDEQ
jgi:replication factor A1